MEVYRHRINLSSGYYIDKEEYFEAGWGTLTKEKHFDPYGKCVYQKEYNNNGYVWEAWRWYHDNGELAGVSDSTGFIQRFDRGGLPIK